jgi:hypothetical protein
MYNDLRKKKIDPRTARDKAVAEADKFYEEELHPMLMRSIKTPLPKIVKVRGELQDRTIVVRAKSANNLEYRYA